MKKFVEDITQEDKIDIDQLSNAEFKHPLKQWFRYKLLIIQDKIEIMGWNIANACRRLIK